MNPVTCTKVDAGLNTLLRANSRMNFAKRNAGSAQASDHSPGAVNCVATASCSSISA